ncbi:MAG: glycoside hydrolase family 38 C-terminal domain-containing protein [Clostridiaceae bacterium]
MDMESIVLLEELKKDASGGWTERIIAQLDYAVKISGMHGGKYDSIIGDALRYTASQKAEEGVITKNTAIHAEDMLKEMSGAAKRLNIICAAHAHIDMNWMWGFHETVAVALDTFRTMLNLMDEYPCFTFSQSQASVYRIVEEYDPGMLGEIRERVREGRWEVTASTWVETDKNMPNGESLARHILYTRKYLSELLDLDPESLKLDFEPDTFGHSRNVPEILARGGIKYYYHCRGYSGHNVYRWKAPSGSNVIVYREPLWYNAAIDAKLAAHVPEFCSRNGVNTVLKVYGVGDHGGGPTRRDIEKLIDMGTWPIFPTVRFGTFNEYFRILEGISDKLPVVDQELNYIFTGCYTTQTRIKLANRLSEARLNEAESFGSIAALFAGGDYPGKAYEKAWEKVLFNQFHDIIPGSGVIETREYAMGQFQQVLAAANTGITKSLRMIASQVATSAFGIAGEDYKSTNSEGAGVGHSVTDFGLPQVERGRGKNRYVNVFNPSAHDRKEPVEFTLWDWPGDISRLEIRDAEGNTVRHQILKKGKKTEHCSSDYWGHEFIKLLADVSVPAYGYNTYAITEHPGPKMSVIRDEPRNEYPHRYILENDLVRVVFNTQNAAIVSLIDKSRNTELVDSSRTTGIFRLIEEDDSRGMTAWVVGRYMNIEKLTRDVRVTDMYADPSALRQWISYTMKFRDSELEVTVSLDSSSARLNYSVKCDWQERAAAGKFIPQLSFYMPLNYSCSSYKYDIPYGTITRESLDMDVPANNWAVGMPDGEAGGAVMLVSETKYGFRGFDNSISMTLIRSAYDPDPYPENYVHRIRFAVDIADSSCNNADLIMKGYDYNHPISFVSNLPHGGSLPTVKGFITLESGAAVISSVKLPESSEGKLNQIIVRVYEADGEKADVILKFERVIQKAWFVDLNENRIECDDPISVSDTRIGFNVKPFSICGICVEFKC